MGVAWRTYGRGILWAIDPEVNREGDIIARKSDKFGVLVDRHVGGWGEEEGIEDI